ncbi:penicillin-binding transpeptidase domain-containing protein [Alphaproteobacteria bacterium endosymbiont of Tiliacea citrago]|uniref:penicillin-binding transpeptidase domain-containing protein n=1 Tax=Alphaproteobacteria bacterium endosymbiont of Tiliacea citrago TaxID=3077944 RepID=UPI00313BCC3F
MNKSYKLNLSILLFLFAVFPIKLTFLYFVFSKPVKVKSNKNRSEILDAENNLIATSMQTYSIYSLPHEVIDDYNVISKNLSDILNQKQRNIYRRLTLHNKFVWITRHISPQKANQASSFGYSGIYISKDCIRFYPFVNLFLHVLGKVTDENNGLTGVEKYYDDYLKNEDNPPLKLSLKSSVQNILRQELLNGKLKYNANFVSGIIICAKTGKILAMYSKTSKEKKSNPHVLDAKNDTNIAIQSRYELGSIMKVLSSSMFFEKDIVNPETKLAIPASYSIGGHKIKDYALKHSNTIELSFQQAFLYSSNVAFISLAETIELEDQKEFYKKIGLFEDWSIDKIFVKGAITPKKIRKCDVSVFSYGYGISISLSTYCRAVLRVLTGKNMDLHIEQNPLYKKEESLRIIDKSTVKKLRFILGENVRKHVSKYNFRGISVGGKTGTAKKYTQKGYISNSHMSSFVFVYPLEDPQIIGLIVLDDPKKNDIALFGSQSSMLISFSIIEKLINLNQ